eukprot:4042427-Amphidinium_carterae.1
MGLSGRRQEATYSTRLARTHLDVVSELSQQQSDNAPAYGSEQTPHTKINSTMSNSFTCSSEAKPF